MKKIIVIGGPTSSGKTKLAIEIAKKFNGELINADSRQIYKYLDIGTNKGDLRRRDVDVSPSYSIDNIPVHLVSFLNPDERFSVYDYKILAEKTIADILNRGKVPIVVGGTGLYIDAIIKNYELLITDYELDPEYRNQLNNLTVKELQIELQAQSPKLLAQLNDSDRNNPRRLIRIIEKSKSNESKAGKRLSAFVDYDYLFLYPKYDWEELKSKIENRVEQMFGSEEVGANFPLLTS